MHIAYRALIALSTISDDQDDRKELASETRSRYTSRKNRGASAVRLPRHMHVSSWE